MRQNKINNPINSAHSITSKATPNGTEPQPVRLQVVGGIRKRGPINSATGMNHHTMASVYRVIFESDLNISTLRQAARMFRMPETQILDILRTQVRNRTAGPNPPSGGSAMRFAA